jgi:hypothetical protein
MFDDGNWARTALVVETKVKILAEEASGSDDDSRAE